MYSKSEAVPKRAVSASTAAGARSENATVNRRLREYLQLLEAGRPDVQDGFCSEFFDDAKRSAVKIYHRRDRDNVAKLHNDDLCSAIHDAFDAIFTKARLGLLNDLTWPYVIRAIYFALTPFLKRGWQQAGRQVELEEEIVDLLVDEDAVCLFGEEFWDWVEEIFVAAGLTEEEKQVVLLRLFGVKTCEEAKSMDSAELTGMTWPVVAERLGIPEIRARRRYSTALTKLRGWLEREFG